MALRYISTRGSAPELDFADVLLTGLAADGGLYVPKTWPQLSNLIADPEPASDLATPADPATAAVPETASVPEPDTGPVHGFDRNPSADPDPAADGSYPQMAAEVIWPFVEGSISRNRLETLLEDAYSTFNHPEVCPLRQIGEGHYLMELFHGPTLAFKDIALQVVGRLFDYELGSRASRVTIVGATSGDTGSAAMEAVRGSAHVDLVMLFPNGRTTEVQRRQMTTLAAPNAPAVAIEGTFDDCQDLVKAMFGDAEFSARHNLAAVNSINWARVMAQVVYYFWAAKKLDAARRPISFCVPTGNFGNILAGYVAAQMGLNVGRLLVASNSNDILTRFAETGELKVAEVVPTWSPSMDIQISSNLERLLFDLFDRDAESTAAFMQEFRNTGTATLSPAQHANFLAQFGAGRQTEAETLQTIAGLYETQGIVVDPHTAVGIGVAERLRKPEETMVTLATAHPAKFGDAVEAATGHRPPLVPRLSDIFERTETYEVLPNDLNAIMQLVDGLR